jgi:amidase
MPATDLAAMVRNREVSARELLEAHIHRIEKINPVINAIVCKPFEAARNQAEAADRALARGDSEITAQPLFGVPVTIKDAFDVEGLPTTCGVPSRQNHTAESSATAVRKLTQAGAIVLGKTNLPSLCMHFETDNSVFHRTHNPYDLERTPGGSSGGEAAIIAACGSPLGLGTDGGGSIRTPAAFCGIAGIRPGWGRVSLAGTFPSPPQAYGNYYTAGPMARHVKDLAVALQVLAGQDPRDPFTFPVQLNNFRDVQLKQLRVAFWNHYTPAKTCGSTSDTVAAAAKFLSNCVREVSEVCPPLWNQAELILKALYDSEIVTFESALKDFGVSTPCPVDEAAITYAQNNNANRLPDVEAKSVISDLLPKFQVSMLEFLDKYDVFLCPVCAIPAMPHGTSWNQIDVFGFTLATSMIPKVPAGSVRCGWSEENLPIGVQVVSKPYREDIVLAVMEALECEFGGWKQPPEQHLVTT